MPDNPKDNKTAEDKAKEKNQAQTKKVTDFLNENKLDVRSQMFIVLGNGELVPIQGITAQSLVVDKEEDGPVEQTKPDSGKSQE